MLVRHTFNWSKRILGNKVPKSIRRYLSTKQLVYKEWGDPSKVLEMISKDLNPNSLATDEVLVKWLAAPINPADINQIQGVYPVKPPLPAVGGNEGCAVVTNVGRTVTNLMVGDFVIPARSGLGTWTEHAIHNSSKLFRIDNKLPIEHAATLQVNPPTAYRMLQDFVQLREGDWVVQNGANSAVGRYVIQICRILNLKTINVVRNRETINDLKSELKSLGANEVLTEEEFVKAWRDFKNVKLALNCVGGRSSLMLSRCLSTNGCVVTYGGMSKQPLQIPTGSLIFTDISLRGFWMSRWYEIAENATERQEMYRKLADWIKHGELQTPPFLKIKFDSNFNQAFEENENSQKRLFVF